jgi:hypothetical protein
LLSHAKARRSSSFNGSRYSLSIRIHSTGSNRLPPFQCEKFSELFKPENVHVETYGNVLSESAFPYGIGQNEIRLNDLMKHNPSYQVIVAVAAKKQ